MKLSNQTCLYCEQSLIRKEWEKPSEFRKRKFCHRQCSCSYRNQKSKTLSRPRTSPCNRCGEEVFLKFNQASRSYCKRLYCDTCLSTVRSEKGKQNIANLQRISSSRTSGIENKTKGEMFARRKNWQSARSSICRHATQLYLRSDRPNVCAVCGYAKHVEVCHLIPVSKFDNDTLVSTINDLSNLVALCPNHHWELDKGLLKLVAGVGVEPTVSRL